MVQQKLFWEEMSKFAYGSAFILGGVGVAYLSKYIPQEYRTIGYAGAFGIGAYGAYNIYKAFKEEEAEKPTPDLTFPMFVRDPTLGEKWSRALPHTVNVDITNPYSTSYRLYGGMSMIHESGEIFDFPIVTFTIKANDTGHLTWYMYGSPQGSGLYWIVTSVWDVYPTGDCEVQGTCHRLGEAESSVEFGWFG